jgi:hypothetical protein
MDLDAVLRLTGLIVVPQLAGLVVTALARWLSWLAWPAAAISAFGVVWHQMVWTPAQSAARHCGTADFGLVFILGIGLLVHLGLGTLLGVVAVRRWARRVPSA